MKEKNKGILCIICAAFCFALMNLFVKMSGDIPTLQKAFFRNIVAIFFSLSLLLKHIQILLPAKETGSLSCCAQFLAH